MTIRWQCAGAPHCRKTFLYARGLKAHMPTCKYAQSKKVKDRRDELQTMLDIVMFVEDDQRGNITFSRHVRAKYIFGSMELSQFSRVLTDQGSAPHRTTPHQGVRQGPSYVMPATRREPARQERPSAGPEAAEDAAEDAAGDVSAIFPSRESVRPTEYGATGPRASTPRQQGEEMVGLGQEGTTAVQERLLDMARD